MPKIRMLHLIAVATGALGLGAALAAVMGATELALAMLGAGVAALGALVTVVVRRLGGMLDRLRVDASLTAQHLSALQNQLVNLTDKVDAMQRRVVGGIEAVRLEAADRHTSSRSDAWD